jgi:glycosyltransferase involved in cell wall biosynthesis
MTRFALDGIALRRMGRGVSRSLRELLPLLTETGTGLDCVTFTTDEGRQLLDGCGGEIVVVPSMPSSIWEQLGLPWYARKFRAQVVFSLSECGPLWGPKLLLNVPEDPYIRWAGATAATWREKIRRVYERTFMTKSLRHAVRVVANCDTTACALASRFGIDLSDIAVVHLGVDGRKFYPDLGPPREDMIFHLGSDEPRDQSVLVVRAYARALQTTPTLPDLAIAGELGARARLVDQTAAELGIQQRVRLLGRISDEELRSCYSHAAICAQPAQYEGFGLQPLEALSCGAPLIVFPDPAVREVVNGAAVVVEERAETALTRAITDLWADSELRATLREKGPKRAAEFSWAATAEKFRVLLSELAQEA